MSLYSNYNTLQEEIQTARQLRRDIEIIKAGKRTKCKFCKGKFHLIRPIIVKPGLTPSQFGIMWGDEIRKLACMVCRNDIMTQGWSSRIRTGYQLWKYIKDDVRFRD